MSDRSTLVPDTAQPSRLHGRQPVGAVIALTLLIVIAALAYITGSVTITRSTFTWEPSRTGEPVPLLLSAQSPETLRATGDCALAASPESQDLVLTGESGQALTLRAQGATVWMEYAGVVVGSPVAAPAGCEFVLTYAREDNTARLSVGETVVAGELSQPTWGGQRPPYRQFAMTQLWAAPGVGVVVTTQPTTFGSSAWRMVWVALCVGGMTAMGVLLRRRYPWPAGSPGSPRWTGQDLLVAVVAAVGLIVVPPRFDDGWVLTTVREYSNLGFFSNYYSNDAVAQPQGFWWAWIERLWLTPLGTPGFLLRLPTMLIVMGTWWFLRREVLAKTGVGRGGQWSAAIITCAGAVGLLVTIRPEPLVALLVTAAIAVVVRYSVTRQPHLLVVLAGLSALGMAVHQTGWSVVGASCAALPWALPWLRQPGSMVMAAAIGVSGVATSATLAMLGSNATLWWRSGEAFRRDTYTYQSILDEGDRVGGLATRTDSPTITILAVALILLAALGFLLRTDRHNATSNAAGWAAMAAMGGLFLTSSKLVDHYGVVVPAGAVLAGIAVTGLRPTVARAAIVATVAVGSAAFIGGGTWALQVDRVTDWRPGPWPVVAAGMTVLLAGGCLFWARRVGGTKPLCVTLGVVVSAAMGLSVTPVIVEGIRYPGSWFGQQMTVATGRTCGILDATSLRDVPPSVFEVPQVTDDGVVPVPPNRAVWAKGPLFTPIGLQVVSADGSVRDVLLPPTSRIWSYVPLGPDARQVVLHQRGVSLVSSAVGVTPAREAVSADPDAWWVDPALGLQAPCVRPVSIRSGLIHPVRHSVGRPTWSGGGLVMTDRAVWEAGCVGDTPEGTGVCIIQIAGQGQPLAGEVTTEVVG